MEKEGNAYSRRLDIINGLQEISLTNPEVFNDPAIEVDGKSYHLHTLGLFFLAGLRIYGPDKVAAMQLPDQKANELVLGLLAGVLADRSYRDIPYWQEKLNRVGLYYGSSIVDSQIGQVYGVGRAAIEITRRTVINDLKQRGVGIPGTTPEFPIGKKISISARKRNSVRIRGASLEIINEVKNGATLKDLQESGYSTIQIRTARRAAKIWDLVVPYIVDHKSIKENDRKARQLLRLSKDPKYDRLIKSYFDRIRSRRSFRHSMFSRGVFISVSEMARLIFSVDPRKLGYFIKVVERGGIPIFEGQFEQLSKGKKRQGKYHDILVTHSYRSLALLLEETHQENSKLSQFLGKPYKIIIPPQQGKLPTTTNLIDRTQYKTASSILEELGINMKGKKTEELYKLIFGADCPVAIYNYGKRRALYPISQENKLRAYIKMRLSQLGLMF